MSTVQFATFVVEETLYGIEILQIREVIRHVSCSPVPQAPAIVYGLMNLRGQIVTVIDLAKSIGIERGERSRNICVILKSGEELAQQHLLDKGLEDPGTDSVGLLVDRMGEVVTIEDREIDSSPANVSPEESTFVRGVVKLRDELLTILSLSRVLQIPSS